MSGNNSIVTVTCPACQAQATPRGRSLTRAMTCPKCHSYFRLFQHNSDKYSKFVETHKPTLPIGAKGKIEGITYEVMGFTVKREKYSYKWREYFLFNPFHGAVYLSEFDGHWNFLKQHLGNPTNGSRDFTFEYEGATFRLYQKYSPRVLHAEGEFFQDEVYVSEDSTVAEYIAPPYLFVSQFTDSRHEWLRGKYINSSEIEQGFKIAKEVMPIRTGMGYTEPTARSFSETNFYKVILAAVLLLVTLQIFFQNQATPERVFSKKYYKSALTEQKMFSSESFSLEGGTKSLMIEIQAPISNDWFYADFSLIEEATGTEHAFSKEIEYYHGVESGDSWSEGSTRGEAFLSKIPEGRYHINIYPEFSFNSEYFEIDVYHNEPIYSNFFITLLILALYPIYYFTRKYYKEVKRWSDSDYSPYASEE
jgi:hypothetical protein